MKEYSKMIPRPGPGTGIVNTRNNPTFSHAVASACNPSAQEGCPFGKRGRLSAVIVNT